MKKDYWESIGEKNDKNFQKRLATGDVLLNEELLKWGALDNIKLKGGGFNKVPEEDLPDNYLERNFGTLKSVLTTIAGIGAFVVVAGGAAFFLY